MHYSINKILSLVKTYLVPLFETMRKGSLVVLFCLILLGNTYADNTAKIPDSLFVMAKTNPLKTIALLEKNKLRYSHHNDYYYLLALAKEELGLNTEVDSLLSKLLINPNITKDSSFYIRLLLLDAENKKVLDRFEEASTSIFYALQYQERHFDTTKIIDLYITMAEYYRATDNYDYAMIYLDKANRLGNNMPQGFPVLLKARMLGRRAAIYMEQGLYLDSVEYFSKEALSIGVQTKNFDLMATAYNELGYLYMNTNRVEAGLYFKRALQLWEKLDYGIYANNARLNLARFYLRTKQQQKALDICKQGLVLIKANHWDWEEGYTYEVMSKAYGEIGEYKQAALYADLAREKLLNNSRKQYKSRLAYYSNQLELKDKEELILISNQEKQTAQQQVLLKSNENRLLILSLIVSFLVLFGFIVFTIIIARQKKTMALQQKEIGKINIQLNELLAQKEVLLKEINHRIKNNLGMLSGLMYLEEKRLKNTEAIKIIQELNAKVHTISLIHETLYKRDDMEKVNLQEYLSQLWNRMVNLYPSTKKIAVHIECQDFNPDLSVAIPLAMMINELMTNSLKHAFSQTEKPEIRIVYSSEKKLLEYMDNGPGSGSDLINVPYSFGKKMLDIFARQIKARIEFEKNTQHYITRIILN